LLFRNRIHNVPIQSTVFSNSEEGDRFPSVGRIVMSMPDFDLVVELKETT